MISYSRALLACVLLFFLTCGRSSTDRLFPESDFQKNWRISGTISHYDPQNLYEYIDGEAELYHHYGFLSLASASYRSGEKDDHVFTVDIYRMKDDLNAFGLYSNYRAPEYQYHQIGTEGYQTESRILFYKGPFVVEIEAGDFSNTTVDAMRKAAARIDQKMPFPAEPPLLLSLLPEQDQIEHTLRYIPAAMLSQSFLPQGLEAAYRCQDEKVTCCVVVFQNAVNAEEGMRSFLDFYRDSGTGTVQENENSGVTTVQTRFHGTSVWARVNQYMAGIQDLSNPEKGYDLLDRMRRTLLYKETSIRN